MTHRFIVRNLIRLIVTAMLLSAAVMARASEAPPLQVIAPAELRSSTSRDFVNVLGRTTPGTRVRIAGQEVPVYATGIFVRDRVPLATGSNRIRVEADAPEGGQAVLDLELERAPPPAPAPPPLPADRVVIDTASIQPQAVLRVAPGETVPVRLRGTPGLLAEARLPGQPWQALAEDKARPGQYRADVALSPGPDTEPQAVEVRLSVPRTSALRPAVPGPSTAKSAAPQRAALRGARPAKARSAGSVGRWNLDAVRLYSAGPDGANLLHGLHEVRLGGPNLAELPAGTVLRVVGQQGGHYRVRLAADTHAWVSALSVVPAEPGTLLPAPVFTGALVAGTPEGDVLTLPFPAPAPYAVRSVGTPDGRIVLEADLFGTHLATTWVTQLASARLVREVTLEQPADGRVRVRIVPHDRRIWGWRVEQTNAALHITLRSAPAIATDAPSPLADLLVALEPGHGGPSNLGAVGATQTPEKDINRWTTEALKAELESAGARVVLVREGDDNPSLRERAQRVTASGANLFVSVHANAADTSQGYLHAAGTSLFYKHPASRELSTAIHRRLLEATALPDFGNVGNFNYAPTRLVTWMPAVLVEQAFVSNPAEEAQLLDPKFRAGIARAVRLGLEDYLRAR